MSSVSHDHSLDKPQVERKPMMAGFDDLKANLLINVGNQQSKIILVTACSGGDGATTVAVKLSEALAQDARRGVLLMDGNFRSPNLHRIFNHSHPCGLPDLSRGAQIRILAPDEEQGAVVDDGTIVISRIGQQNLFLLPCVKSHPEPLSFVRSDRFDECLKALSEKFDYVVIDGAPVQTGPESLVLASKVSGVVMVIQAGVTRRQVAISVRDRLRASGARLLGTVVNRKKYFIPNWLYNRL